MSDDKKPTENIEMLMKYIPEEAVSPQGYIKLVKSQVLGYDKAGHDRPFEDLLYFLHVCNKTKLDPIAKQIYCVYRWDYHQGKDKMTIQAGIDGLRLIAQRSGAYGGQDDAVFDPVDESAPYPKKATVTVYRVNPVNGERMPVPGTARWNEYAQKKKDGELMGLWKSMPYNQLSKCAEALALRKAFPAELSGIYIKEEMEREEGQGYQLPAPKKKEDIDKGVSGEVQENKEEVNPEEVAQGIIEQREKAKEAQA